MKYVYPAVFRPEQKGFSIFFPDIRMGGTHGDDIADGLEMAHDFLVGAMAMLEDEGQEIPTSTEIASLNLKDGEFASFVSVDTAEYRRKLETKAVKKTLTLPSWLNAKAEAANINFSHTLQRALKEDLKIAN
ncbi:MAG: type II toxin-antitoxin system HicB family antitoxin [Defluviitaleaceae bacterium]|nr:type II toxin-antitoxin system HicB family antitoxin [Defluviitaleaceae bacterium]